MSMQSGELRPHTTSDVPDDVMVRVGVIAILVLAAALRWYGLGSFTYDQDELYTLIEARTLLDSPLTPGIEGRPLFYFLMHPLLEWLPAEKFWVRMPAFMFGVAGVWVTWKLAWRLAGPVAGLAAMLFIAVSPWHLYASGMARYWSLVYLAGVGFWCLYVEALERQKVTSFLLAFVPLAVGTLSHPTFLFPVPAAVFLLHGSSWRSRDVQRRVPWRAELLGLWLPLAGMLLAWWCALQFMGENASVRNFDGRGPAAVVRIVPAMIQWMGPTMAAATLGGMIVAFKGEVRWRLWAILSAGGLASGVALLLAAALVTNVYADYGISLLPFVFTLSGLLVGFIALRASEVMHQFLVAGIVVTIVLGGVLPSTVSHMLDGTRFDYRPAYARIQAESPQTFVIARPLIQQGLHASELRATELNPDKNMLDAALAREGDVWLVASFQRYGMLWDQDDIIQSWVNANCRAVDKWERARLDYRSYRVELYRCREQQKVAKSTTGSDH